MERFVVLRRVCPLSRARRAFQDATGRPLAARCRPPSAPRRGPEHHANDAETGRAPETTMRRGPKAGPAVDVLAATLAFDRIQRGCKWVCVIGNRGKQIEHGFGIQLEILCLNLCINWICKLRAQDRALEVMGLSGL